MESSRNVDLPLELIHEILLRLPVKALLRFKCVCKEWCVLIGSWSFIDGHYGHESNPVCPLIRFHSYRKGVKFAMYRIDGRHLRRDESSYLSQMPNSNKFFALMGPANGVFCVVRICYKRIALFNPATRKFKSVPQIPLPKLELLEFGFGLDPFSGDYKVVVFEVESKSKRFFCVYNSSSDSWRKIEVVDWFRGTYSGNQKVFSNGVYYWMNVNNVRGCKYIHAFDMRSESFRKILVPNAIRRQQFKAWMTEYGDSIALLSSDVDVERCFHLWVMGSDGLLTKCFTIAIDIPQNPKYTYPVCVWNKNELLFGTIARSRKSLGMFMCDISTQKVRKFLPEFDDVLISKIFSSYKESLVSIKGERDIADFVQDFFGLSKDD